MIRWLKSHYPGRYLDIPHCGRKWHRTAAVAEFQVKRRAADADLAKSSESAPRINRRARGIVRREAKEVETRSKELIRRFGLQGFDNLKRAIHHMYSKKDVIGAVVDGTRYRERVDSFTSSCPAA